MTREEQLHSVGVRIHQDDTTHEITHVFIPHTFPNALTDDGWFRAADLLALRQRVSKLSDELFDPEFTSEIERWYTLGLWDKLQLVFQGIESPIEGDE